MSQTIADLLLRFRSDFSDLTSGLAGAERQLNTFKKGVLDIAGSTAAAFAAVVAGSALLVTNSAEQAKEIERMALVANVSIEDIQALGYASDQVGVPMDKMADILKDVNDKLGDFTLAGAGGFTDFFEQVAPKVGITADELSKLSSEDVLIAVKTAMDDANIPMKEQIFLLESISSDAAALIPLIDDHGKKLKGLKSDYKDLNVSMSQYDIDTFKEMDKDLTNISLKISSAFKRAVVASQDQIKILTGAVVEALDAWSRFIDRFNETPRTKEGVQQRFQDNQKLTKAVEQQIAVLEERQKKFEELANGPRPTYNSPDYLEWKKANSAIEIVKNQISTATEKHKELVKSAEDLQALYKKMTVGSGNGNGEATPEIPASNAIFTDSKLTSLDQTYAKNELEKLKLTHNKRLDEIKNLQISELEIRKRGFDSLQDLQASYVVKENALYEKQKNEIYKKNAEKLKVEQQSNDSTLSSIQNRYVTEENQLKISHDNQISEINRFNISQQEAVRLGYESTSEMKKQLIEQENSFYAEQQVALLQQEQQTNMLRIAQFEAEYGGELEQLQLSHLQKLQEIENFKISEQQAIAAGFESASALRQHYYQLELDEFSEQQEKLEEERKKRQQLSHLEAYNQQLSAAGQITGLIEQTAKEGTAAQKAAFLASKAIAAAEVIIQSEVAAINAGAADSRVGGLLGFTTSATAIRAMGAISAGLILSQGISGIAHSGIDQIPREGTWLLDKGERVYTNESAKQIDTMYQRFMQMNQESALNTLNSPVYNFNNIADSSILNSNTNYIDNMFKALSAMHNQPFASNQPVNNEQNEFVTNDNKQPWQINIYDAPAGTTAEVDDEKKIISIMMKDANSNGQYISYISQKLGVKNGGYK